MASRKREAPRTGEAWKGGGKSVSPRLALHHGRLLPTEMGVPTGKRCGGSSLDPR